MLTVTVDNSSVQDVLAKIAARMDDLSKPMDSIGQTLESRVRNRFETETDPLGHPWAPWAESTRNSYPFPGSKAAASSDSGAGNARVLDRYSDMLDGVSYQADATSVRVGFNQLYSTFHEFGTERMPRRGLLTDDPEEGTLAPADEAAVLDILNTFLTADL